MPILYVVSLLLLTTAQPVAQPELYCYPYATQIGTAARRDFRDDNGFVVKAIYYQSNEDGFKPPTCADETLREQRTTTYVRDTLGRVLVESTSGDVNFIQRNEYVGNDMKPSVVTIHHPDGRRRGETRYGARGERVSLQFDRQQRVTGIDGRVPDDLELAFEWGPQVDGWRCGIALHPEASRGDVYINLHLYNVTAPSSPAAVISSFETELRDDRGTIVPVADRNYPSRGISGGPGFAGFMAVSLGRRYGVLQPGRYSLQVRHPHPTTSVMLVSNTLTFEVPAR